MTSQCLVSPLPVDLTWLLLSCRFTLGAERSATKALPLQATLRVQALVVRGQMKLAFGSGWIGAWHGQREQLLGSLLGRRWNSCVHLPN